MKKMICIFLSLNFYLYGQSLSFGKLYDVPYGHSLYQNEQGEYLFIGSSDTYPDPLTKVIKIDSVGNIIWDHILGDYGTSSGLLYKTSIIPLANNQSAVLLTANEDYISYIRLIIINQTGERVWQRTMKENAFSNSLQLTANNGFLISGYTTGKNRNIFIAQTDAFGTILWQKEIEYTNRFQIKQDTDSSYVLVYDRTMEKLNRDGETIWSKNGIIGFNRATYILPKENKNFIILGEKHTFFPTLAFLVEIDTVGNILWEKEIDGRFNSIKSTADKGFILAGDRIVKTDSAGETEWIGEIHPTINQIIETKDGGYAWIGSHQSCFFAKMDSDGFFKYLILTNPQDNSNVYYNSMLNISWDSKNIENISIAYSANNGQDWQMLKSSFSADDTFLWRAPVEDSDQNKIRISDAENEFYQDENLIPFTLRGPAFDFIAVNEIKMFFNNNGSGSHNDINDGPGLFWPGGLNAVKNAVYQDGLIWAGKVDLEIRANGNNHKYGLVPGNIIGPGIAADPNDPQFGIWKIRRDWGVLPPGIDRDRMQHDYLNWPTELGAPWMDHDNDGIYNPDVDQPKIYGNETNWFVMNDTDTSYSHFLFGTDPIGLEIQCTIYGYDTHDDLKDVIFKKYKILNKGLNNVDSMYLGYWSDPDLGGAGDDYVGCDTTLDLAFCYNGDNDDSIYDIAPAVGYLLLQGPIIRTTCQDSAWFNDQWYHGFTNLGMTAFTLYQNDNQIYWDPECGAQLGANQTFYYLSGRTNFGKRHIDPNTGFESNFALPGDPVVGTGWYEGAGWPNGPAADDRRMQLGSGPFSFAPDDSQEVVLAIIIAQGKDHLDSITKLKTKAAKIRNFYYNGLLTGLETNLLQNSPAKFNLSQNYPNPFNPITNIEYRVKTHLNASPHINLSIYNLLGQKVTTLVNQKQTAGSYNVEWDATGFASGVYVYRLETNSGYKQTKKLVLLK